MGRNFFTLGNFPLSRSGAHIPIVACAEIGFHPLVLYTDLGVESVLVNVRNLISIDHIAPSRISVSV